MDRGPMALFGAIVAVGLGPAMWLGAHFSDVGATPSKPPAATSEHQAGPSQTQDAGQGAGSAPQDPSSIVLDTQPKSNNYKPLRRGSSASPSASPSTEPDPSTSPSDGTVKPDPSDDQSTPPTETTTDPSGGGQGGDPGTGGDEPPAPPGTDSGGSGGTAYAEAPSV